MAAAGRRAVVDEGRKEALDGAAGWQQPASQGAAASKVLDYAFTQKMHDNGRSCVFQRVCCWKTRRGRNRQREKWTNKICIKPGKLRVLEDEKDGGCQNGPNRARESETKKDRKQ